MAKNKRYMAKSNEANALGKLNQIVEGTEIKGDITSNSNIRVDGKIIGTLNITGKLVLGLSGYIEGEVSCENAEIEGEFLGNIKVGSFLSLKSTAKINGNIHTQKMAVEPGALYTGNCTMGNEIKVNANNTVSKEV